jgi:AcrR family transcriptional regulator
MTSLPADSAALRSPVPVILDPTRPIVRPGPGDAAPGQSPAFNQRYRRSTILATIRQLLAEEGLEGITVRRIAERSGHAVQTIYNLVGPRDLAITEAISEYSQYVNLTAAPDPSDPDAPAAIVCRELASIRINPDFCRNVCLIFFTSSRGIFYDFRDRQVKALHRFLIQQQRSGVLRREVNALGLAEQIMFFLGALCIDWADGRMDFESLCDRIFDGYENLMVGALVRPDFRLDRSAPMGAKMYAA